MPFGGVPLLSCGSLCAGAAPAFGAPASGEESAAGGNGGEAADPEEECKAEFKPVVQLDEVEAATGEEDEEVLFEMKSKLYRFESGEWKERGLGMCKLLKHKELGKVRMLMRREKILKICANFVVAPGTALEEHPSSEKGWVFGTMDFSEGEAKQETFFIKFGTEEKAADFKAKFEEAQKINAEGAPAAAAEGEGETKEEDTAADELAKELESKAKATDKGDEDKE